MVTDEFINQGIEIVKDEEELAIELEEEEVIPPPAQEDDLMVESTTNIETGIGKIEVKNHDQPGFPTKKQDYEKNKTRSKSNSVLFGSGLEHGRCSS